MKYFTELQNIISIKPEHISVKDVENPVGNRLKKKYIYTHPTIKSTVRKLSGKKGTEIMGKLSDIKSGKKVLKEWVLWHIEEYKKPLAAAGEGSPTDEEGPSIIETKKYVKSNWEDIQDKLKGVKGSDKESKNARKIGRMMSEMRSKLKGVVKLIDKTNEKVHGEYPINFLTLLHHLRRQEYKVQHIPKHKVEVISVKDKKAIESIKKEIEKLQVEFKKKDKYLKKNKLNPKDKPRSKKEEKIFKEYNDILTRLAELNTEIENLEPKSTPIHDILRERYRELRRSRSKYEKRTGGKEAEPFPKEAKEPQKKPSKEKIEEEAKRPMEEYLPKEGDEKE